MGAVYRARQVDLDTTVAIKVLHPELMAETTFAARFKREAKAASRIDHPNSMRVLDYGQEPDGLLYIAMEFLEGKNLHRILHEQAPLAAARVANLIRQALAALAAAHELQILHRDLKPENIIVIDKMDDEGSSNELVKVCDFGIAKFTAPHAQTTGGKLTELGTIIGTPDYMSPEQAQGEEIDVRSDLYSIGVILYEALTGKCPFVAETPLAIVLKHINEAPRPPSSVVLGIDPTLEAICMRALKKSRGERFASAREMRTALMSVPGTAGRPAGSSPLPFSPPTPMKALTLVSDTGPLSAPSPVDATATVPDAPRPAHARSAVAMLGSDRPPSGSRAGTFVLTLALGAAALGGALWLRSRHRAEAEPPPSAPSATTIAVVPPVVPTPPIVAPPPPAVTVITPAPSGAAPVASSKVPGKKTPATSAAAAPPPPPAAPPTSTAAAPDTPVQSAPPPPPPPPSVTSHVVVKSITSTQASGDDIRAALPMRRFDQCYQSGFAGRTPVTASAQLHLVISNASTVARVALPDVLAPIADCMAEAARGTTIRNLPAADSVAADVDLSFHP